MDGTFDYLRRNGTFEVLGSLFPDGPSSRYLLEDAGVSVGQVRPFGQLTPELYWREVCRVLADGRFRNVTLQVLLDAALEWFPQNEALRRAAGARSGTGVDSRLRVLCLAASPIDQARIRLDAEHREIVMATRRTPQTITPILHPAVRVDDVAIRLLDARPDIVHFGGHGDVAGRLCLENERGLTEPVGIELLDKLFSAVGHLRAVVLTSCYSGAYAEALAGCADFVIGSPDPLPDACALRFTRQFYEVLATNPADRPLDIQACFDVVDTALALPGCPPHTFICHRSAAS